jgi:hypothetical protein
MYLCMYVPITTFTSVISILMFAEANPQICFIYINLNVLSNKKRENEHVLPSDGFIKQIKRNGNSLFLFHLRRKNWDIFRLFLIRMVLRYVSVLQVGPTHVSDWAFFSLIIDIKNGWLKSQCARRAIAKGKEHSQRAVIEWNRRKDSHRVTKIYYLELLCALKGTFSHRSWLHCSC